MTTGGAGRTAAVSGPATVSGAARMEGRGFVPVVATLWSRDGGGALVAAELREERRGQGRREERKWVGLARLETIWRDFGLGPVCRIRRDGCIQARPHLPISTLDMSCI